MRRTFALLTALVLVLVTAQPVSGGQWRTAKNVPKWLSGGTVSWTYTDRDADGKLSWDDDIVFTVTPPTALNNWYASVECSQGKTLIYYGGGWVHYGPGTDTSRLDSWAWADNTGADCALRVGSVDGTVSYLWWSASATVAP